MSEVLFRQMTPADVAGVTELQRLAFPPPFDEELLWAPEHLHRHLDLFPRGQFVAVVDGSVIGSCSNTRISESQWQAHASWEATVGGPMLDTYDSEGTTLYGLDISVHPDFRRSGIGRKFYRSRFELVRTLGMQRYGTACRMPDYRAQAQGQPPAEYAEAVTQGQATDRTLTPLLRYGLRYLGVIENYMEDDESGNTAVLLEWLP